jgi:uncharacterized repeat protein (TIGR01451 family)
MTLHMTKKEGVVTKNWRRVMGCFLLAVVLPTGARAFDLTNYMEVLLVENVSTTWTTVSLENTYTSAVPVCTYVLETFAGSNPNYTIPPAVTRIRNITSNSFQLRIQGWEDSSASSSDVHCMIVDEGVHTLPNGQKVEAHKVDSDSTTGQYATDGSWQQDDLEDVSSTISHTYTNPVVLGQVISFNDSRASVIYVNDCDSRQNHPFQSNQADGICVGKHIGQIAGSRATEEIGYVVAEAGSGTVNNIFFELARGSDSVAGNNNSNSGDTYSVSQHHTIAVLTQAAEDGGNGSWAVLYGGDPLAGNNIDLAVDEEIAAGDTSRNHTNEQVYYWAFSAAELTLQNTLINDSGGTGTVSLFNLTATGSDSFSGVSGTADVTDVNVTPGTYTLSESFVSGYDASAWVCTGATSFTATEVVLSEGDDAVCTITNDDRPFGTLTLEKDVTNDSGGAALDTDFTLSYSTPGFSGNGVEGDAAVTAIPVPPGDYVINETLLTGYDQIAINCSGTDSDGSDGLTIEDGENVTCVFVNNDFGVDVVIDKSVDDLTPNIGQTLTFSLLVSNNGDVAASNVNITDIVRPGFSYVASSIAGADARNDTDPAGAGLTWGITSLPVGASITVTYDAVVKAP